MNYFDKEKIESICLNEEIRIPIDLRINKKLAIKFLNLVNDSDIEIKNSKIYLLANWAGVEMRQFKIGDIFSEIKDITFEGYEETFDLSIENGESYVANGIFCHNTVNLPKDATEELVSKVYEAGWRAGCKGLTVYRDGCREGILVSNKDEKNKKTFESHAAKRPKTVNADVWTFQNNFEKWIAIVGKVSPGDGAEETPYELFTGKLDSFQIPPYVERGQVVKKRIKDKDGQDISIYNFIYIDKDGYPQEMVGLSRSFNEEYWNYARLISAILRHGMPMQYVVGLITGLKLKGDTLNTWKNGVIRTLKRYVKDGTISGDTCGVCGAKLVFIEGCLKCNSCGEYSKCG